jgi:hypothetical protein
MKSFTIFLYFALLQAVDAERMIRFIFNDGMGTGSECNAADNALIAPIFNITAYLRRRLPSESSIKNEEFIAESERELNTYPAKCKDNCAGYATGTCRATGCIGYRRDRALLAACDVQIATMQAAIDALIFLNKVSPTCKAFLAKTKRKTECYDDIIYGEIESFTFWNMNAGRARRPGSMYHYNAIIQENVPNGFNVCNNIPVNLEAVLNPCVKYTQFNMTGPSGTFYTRTDDGHPMIIFNSTENWSTFGGRFLTPGAYFVSAIPDNFPAKRKTLSFNVISC